MLTDNDFDRIDMEGLDLAEDRLPLSDNSPEIKLDRQPEGE